MSQFLYRRCCEEWENTHSFLQWVNSLFAEFLMTHISRENNICFSSMNEVTCQRCVIHNPRWKNTGRFRQEYTGSHRNMEAVFRPENFRIFSGDFRPVPGRKAQESDRKCTGKNLEIFRPEYCFHVPVTSGVFLPEPSRTLWPGWRRFLDFDKQ